jgi:hypothetical protein
MIWLINTSFKITLNHNKFATAHNKSSAEPLSAEDSLHSRSPLYSFVLRCTPTTASFVIRISYNSSARTPRKTLSFCCPRMRVYWPVTYQWAVYQESLSAGRCLFARYLAIAICEPHRKHLLRHWFYCCVHVFRALPRSGTTCRNIKKGFMVMLNKWIWLRLHSCSGLLRIR